MKNRGILKVRPLEGGFDAWKALGYPLQDHRVEDEEVEGEAVVLAPEMVSTEEAASGGELECKVCTLQEAEAEVVGLSEGEISAPSQAEEPEESTQSGDFSAEASQKE